MLGAGSDTGDKKVMQKQKQKQNKKPNGLNKLWFFI
jgi:hypothetical protein